MNHFNWPKWKKWYPSISLCELDELSDENSQFSSCRNEYDSTWYHVVVQFIPLSLSILSPSVPKDILIGHNWLKVIIYSFERIFMMESRQYSHCCCWVEKKKVNDGSSNGDDGIKGESDWRLKLLKDEKLWKKEVDNRVIVVGNGVWLEVWCLSWREKDVCHVTFRLNE